MSNPKLAACECQSQKMEEIHPVLLGGRYSTGCRCRTFALRRTNHRSPVAAGLLSFLTLRGPFVYLPGLCKVYATEDIVLVAQAVTNATSRELTAVDSQSSEFDHELVELLLWQTCSKHWGVAALRRERTLCHVWHIRAYRCRARGCLARTTSAVRPTRER